MAQPSGVAGRQLRLALPSPRLLGRSPAFHRPCNCRVRRVQSAVCSSVPVDLDQRADETMVRRTRGLNFLHDFVAGPLGLAFPANITLNVLSNKVMRLPRCRKRGLLPTTPGLCERATRANEHSGSANSLCSGAVEAADRSRHPRRLGAGDGVRTRLGPGSACFSSRFTRAMEREFGSMIRMDLLDVVEHLKSQKVGSTIENYLAFTLSGSEKRPPSERTYSAWPLDSDEVSLIRFLPFLFGGIRWVCRQSRP